MARRTFPDNPLVLTVSTGSVTVASTTGLGVRIYTDDLATTLADITTMAGASVTNSQLTIDVNSNLPRFKGPNDNRDTLYARSVAGGSIIPIYALVDDRLDSLETGSNAAARIGTANTHTQPVTIDATDPLLLRSSGGALAWKQSSRAWTGYASDGTTAVAKLDGADSNAIRFYSRMLSAAGDVVGIKLEGDVFAQTVDWLQIRNTTGDLFKITSGGQLYWGGDTNLYRSALGLLKTDGTFYASGQNSRFGNFSGDPFAGNTNNVGLLSAVTISNPSEIILQHYYGYALYTGTPAGGVGTLQGGSSEAHAFATPANMGTVLGFEGIGKGQSDSSRTISNVIGMQGTAHAQDSVTVGLLVALRASGPNAAGGSPTVTLSKSLEVFAPTVGTTRYSAHIAGRTRILYDSATGANVLELCDGSETLKVAFDGATGRMKHVAANESATANAGAATLPANPVGFFVMIDSAGTARKVPYYAT